MSDVNYPDILGGITRGQRANVDFVQCALTTRPNTIAAGQNFEILLLIQNVADMDIDVTVELKLPDHDKASRKNMFFSKSTRLLVGLKPAEVGYMTLPASCSPKTEPGSYVLGLNVSAQPLNKSVRFQLIRLPTGGGSYDIKSLPEATSEQMMQLVRLRWHFQSKRHQIATTFEITPPGLSDLVEFKAGWTSLWTMHDHLDEYILEPRVRAHYELMKRAFTPERIFRPVLNATLKYYKDAGYLLKTGEAVYIAKAMTYMLCKPHIKHPNELEPRPPWPDWYKHLVRVLFQEDRLREHPLKVVTEILYFSLLKDAILFTFDILIKNMQEDFGTLDEQQQYADTIINLLRNNGEMEFGKVYLPLIVGGLFLNRDITVQGEDVRNTLFDIENAVKARASEKTSDNEFVFEMFSKALDKMLEDFRWIP